MSSAENPALEENPDPFFLKLKQLFTPESPWLFQKDDTPLGMIRCHLNGGDIEIQIQDPDENVWTDFVVDKKGVVSSSSCEYYQEKMELKSRSRPVQISIDQVDLALSEK